jgi:RNA recognition motif-containing protein
MTVNIYAGNLSYDMTDDSLKEVFAKHGEVSSAKVVFDRNTGRSRGFGFVEMPNSEEAQKAIEALNGSEVMGRNMRVNEARPRKDKM